MKFFVDTADVAEIAELAATGLLDGVTTNPSLIAKSGREFLDVIAEICALVAGPGERRGRGHSTTDGMMPKEAACCAKHRPATSRSRCR